jgi:hypothetical protein
MIFEGSKQQQAHAFQVSQADHLDTAAGQHQHCPAHGDALRCIEVH